MEVIEIISNFINKDNNVIEVQFRTNDDFEDYIRFDTIEFSYLSDFGYETSYLNFDVFDDDEECDLEFDDDDDEFFIEECELKSFLNEYYTVYPSRLPEADLN
jgi:8-oxo-dGTP pyrophosphatase MutT (NUDIX family)